MVGTGLFCSTVGGMRMMPATQQAFGLDFGPNGTDDGVAGARSLALQCGQQAGLTGVCPAIRGVAQHQPGGKISNKPVHKTKLRRNVVTLIILRGKTLWVRSRGKNTTEPRESRF
jgi:hypothetical protein